MPTCSKTTYYQPHEFDNPVGPYLGTVVKKWSISLENTSSKSILMTSAISRVIYGLLLVEMSAQNPQTTPAPPGSGWPDSSTGPKRNPQTCEVGPYRLPSFHYYGLHVNTNVVFTRGAMSLEVKLMG